ncbi:glycosyltransferase [Ornithinicoccus halotolerans]|uniref:glycosyltransferase n=1 Tax=Ornithinicoccus halotolerans TaxID=1748220 RepID=UPI001298180D|nr:glycosyltransferase [Ornithinicoccus halotolerans]
MHILRVANFVSPTSGGIKTALRHWGQSYQEHGHRATLIVPHTPDDDGPPVTHEEQGLVHRVPAAPVPRTGYSLIWHRAGMRRLITELAPDVIEVSDRTTTRWLGPWARSQGIPTVMVSHENVTGILQRRTPVGDRLAGWLADRVNLRSAAEYDAIACPSEYAAEEFRRNGVPARVVPLGVDLDTFVPSSDHGRLAPDGSQRDRSGRRLQLVHCGRLSPEKNPWMSLAAVRVLAQRGVDVHLTVLGHGPLRSTLLEVADDLPVTFHSYIHGRAELAEVMGRADAAIAPGPVETFGLAALEALACGVPAVCPDEGALQEVVGDAGAATPSEPEAFADAVLELVARGPEGRVRARRQAERFTWDRSGQLMLQLHQELVGAGGAA